MKFKVTYHHDAIQFVEGDTIGDVADYAAKTALQKTMRVHSIERVADDPRVKPFVPPTFTPDAA